MLRLDSKRNIKISDKKEKNEFLKKQDWFGHPISFNFEGSETHNTALGGCCSIIVKIVVFIYIIMKIKILVFRENDTIVA